MIYECTRPTTTLSAGETYSTEDLAKLGADVPNLERKGVLKPVGFISAGAPMSDSEAARTIAELQAKLETAEDERDKGRDELREAVRKIRSLEAGHREGAATLKATQDALANLKGELERLRAGGEAK